MAMQSITILVILAYIYMLAVVQHHDRAALPAYQKWAEAFRDVMIYGTLIVTIVSAWGYLRRGIEIMRAGRPIRML